LPAAGHDHRTTEIGRLACFDQEPIGTPGNVDGGVTENELGPRPIEPFEQCIAYVKGSIPLREDLTRLLRLGRDPLDLDQIDEFVRTKRGQSRMKKRTLVPKGCRDGPSLE